MSRIFMGVGVALLIVGVCLFLLTPPPSGVSVELPESVLAANVRLAIDPDILKGVIKAANDRADVLNQVAVSNRSWAQGLLFAVFIAGSLTAFLAGLQKVLKDLKREEVWLTVAVGLLGSVSAVSSYAAGYLEEQAKVNFGCISTIEREVRKSVKDIQTETDRMSAELYVTELKRNVEQCPG